MKTALPWLLVIILAGGAYFLYADGQKKTAEIIRLTEQANEIESLRTENESLKASASQSAGSTQTQKEHDDLLRLRGEVQTLRQQSKTLDAQLSAAQSQNAQAQETRQQLSQINAENQALRAQAEKTGQVADQTTQPTPAQARDACLRNLAQIDGAKQQWALENKKSPTDVPEAAEIAVYLRGGKLPACPGGGTYVIGNLQTTPTCNIPGHTLE